MSRLTEVPSSADSAVTCDDSAMALRGASSGKDSGHAPVARRPRSWAVYITAIGLVCAAIGIYGVIDSISFGWRAEWTNARIVGFDQSDEGAVHILEFTAAGRSYRVHARGVYGVRWIGGDAVVLYPPGHPEEARLADLHRASQSRSCSWFSVLCLRSPGCSCGVTVGFPLSRRGS